MARGGRFIFLAVIALFALSSLINLLWSAFNPFPNDIVEASIVLLGRMMARGEPIYRDVSMQPYVVNPYNPLHTMMIAALVRIFGVTFVPCKLFSLLVTLLVAVLIFLSIRAAAGRSYWAAVFSLLFLIEPGTIFWGTAVRIDMLTIVFSFGALYLYMIGKGRGLIYVCLLLLGAFFTKQSSIAALCAITAHLFLGGERKKAALFFLSFSLITAAIMITLNGFTGGHYFFSVVRFHMLTGTDPEPAKLIIASFLKNHLPLLILTITSAAAITGLKGFPRRSQALLYVFYLAVLVLQSSTVFKKGASHNHFLELNALCCILIGIFFTYSFSLAECPGGEKSGKLHPAVPAALSALLILIQVIFLWGPAYLFYLPGIAGRSLVSGSPPPLYRRIVGEGRQLMDAIRNYPDPIWSENVAFLLLSDRQIVMGEPFGYTSLPENLWDSAAMLSYFRDRKFSLVILGDRNLPGLANRLSEQAFSEVQKNYVLKEKIGPYHLFVPSETAAGQERPH